MASNTIYKGKTSTSDVGCICRGMQQTTCVGSHYEKRPSPPFPPRAPSCESKHRHEELPVDDQSLDKLQVSRRDKRVANLPHTKIAIHGSSFGSSFRASFGGVRACCGKKTPRAQLLQQAPGLQVCCPPQKPSLPFDRELGEESLTVCPQHGNHIASDGTATSTRRQPHVHKRAKVLI